MKTTSPLILLLLGFLLVGLTACFGCEPDRGPGAHVQVRVDLEPRTEGSGDSYIDIYANDKLVASAKNGSWGNVWLPAGDHRIRAERPGFTSVEKTMSVAKQGTQTIHFTLQRQ